MNVLPDWWTIPFLLFEAVSLVTKDPLNCQLVLSGAIYTNLFQSTQTFRKALPLGWDKDTDKLSSSLRVKLTSAMTALRE